MATTQKVKPAREKPLTRQKAQSSELTTRRYARTQIKRSYKFLGQAVENPDTVIQQFGKAEGIDILFRMMRQFSGSVGAAVEQRIDRAMAIPRNIVPGDANSEASVQLANDCIRWWKSIPSRGIILRALAMGEFVGFAPIEKVWGEHEETGLFAPIELYDLPQKQVVFDAEGSPLLITDFNMLGERIPEHKVFFYRAGSLQTPYGSPRELSDVYLPTWYIQTILEWGFEALEQLGRPLPVVYMPRNLSGPERESVEAGWADQFKYYLTMPTDEAQARVEFPGLGVTAGGGAGKAEQEWVRYIEAGIWSRLLGTAQTSDRGGSGNGKLEEERSSIKDDKTVPLSSALDECLTRGLLHPICEANVPGMSPEMWPRFDSDTSAITAKNEALNGNQAQAVERIVLRYTANHMTESAAIELMILVGVPRQKAAAIIESTKRERGNLTVAPDMQDTKGDIPSSSSDERPEEEEAA